MRHSLLMLAAGSLLACSMDNPAFDPRSTVAEDEGTQAGDGDPTGPGDGDGDPTGPGDGDGDPTGPGDGDGDGDPTGPGDGDGDSDTGLDCGELSECEGMCVDLDTDLDNCGVCGGPCPDHQVCVSGGCVAAKYIFTTKTPVPGGFGGLEAGWDLCIGAAANAQLPGEYVPWMANVEIIPAQSQSGAGPYVRTDRKIVAHDWEELTSEPLLAPINRDEYGQALEPHPAPSCQLDFAVWTGATNDGLWSGDDCGGWYTQELVGGVGDPTSTTQWSSVGLCNEACDLELPIYCVAQ